MSGDFRSLAYEQAKDNAGRALRQFESISVTTCALARAMRAYLADGHAQFKKDMAMHDSDPHHEANERSQ